MPQIIYITIWLYCRICDIIALKTKTLPFKVFMSACTLLFGTLIDNDLFLLTTWMVTQFKSYFIYENDELIQYKGTYSWKVGLCNNNNLSTLFILKKLQFDLQRFLFICKALEPIDILNFVRATNLKFISRYRGVTKLLTNPINSFPKINVKL